MFRKENYRFGCDVWGGILFLIIMIPNFIWFAVPAPNDILRGESRTTNVDVFASIIQVVMIVGLCIITNKECRKPMLKYFLFGIIITTLIYFEGWIFYYSGMVNSIIILDLCIAPCLTLIIFSIARKNIVALLSATIFMVCHLIFGITNFIR